MTHSIRLAMVGLALLFMTACSMEKMIDGIVPDDDRALALRFVDAVRQGNAEAFSAQLDPGIVEESLTQLPTARSAFPTEQGETKFIGYQSNSNTVNGINTTTKNFLLMTTVDGKWTVTTINYAADNGPLRVTGWNVEARSTPPEQLETMQAFNTGITAAAVVFGIALLGGIAIGLHFYRKSQRADRERGIRPPQ